jgi:Ca2+-binding RTX toxin-like protein
MATIIGTENPDDDIGIILPGHGRVLFGTDDDDFIYGLGGDDLMAGFDGDDYMNGGTGADLMDGGEGNDIYIVDNVDDETREFANAGTDETLTFITHTLQANVEKLTLAATAGAIDGTGNGLNNEIRGNSFANVLDGRDGQDTIFGNGGEDALFGGAGNDNLFGGDHNDILTGGLDHDTLDGGAGADEMYGGSGNDTYYVNHSGDLVSEFLGGGFDVVVSSVSFTLPNGVEILELQSNTPATAGEINGTGNALDNTLIGTIHRNTLNGLNGDDLLYSFEGNDTVDGGFGNDEMDGGDGVDTLRFVSWDPIAGEFYSPVLERIRIDLATGTATRTVTNFTTGTVSVVETDTFVFFENVRGSNRFETIVGNSLGNTLEGRGGDDTLQGNGGSDLLDGGTGTDTATYENNLGGRVIVSLGANGADGTASEIFVVGGQLVFPTDTLRSIENVRGTNFNDTITGNEARNKLEGLAGTDTLDGGGEADTLIGGGSNDTYFVDNLNDQVIELAGEDTLDRVRTTTTYVLAAGSQVELLETTDAAGNVLMDLVGNEFDNTIIGNAATNTIVGGRGLDTLVGGRGGGGGHRGRRVRPQYR